MESEALVEFGKPLERIKTDTPTPQGKEVLIKVTSLFIPFLMIIFLSTPVWANRDRAVVKGSLTAFQIIMVNRLR